MRRLPDNRASIDTLQKIQLGDTAQWIRIRGQNVANPVLLLIPQGPGFPLIQEADDFQRSTHLEDNFTIVYWDPRGCGLSTRGLQTHRPITLHHMVDDVVELVTALCARFDTPSIFIGGFSLGGTIAAMAADLIPTLVTALVVVGMDVQFDEAERVAYEYVLSEAARRHHRRAARQLRSIGMPPHLTGKTFGTRVRWLANFGGVMRNSTYGALVGTLLRQLLRSGAYSWADLVRTIRAMSRVQTALLPEMAGLDLVTMLPRLDVPIYLLHGSHDFASPIRTAQSYFDHLVAPRGKEWVPFEDSAHMPQYEESDRFARTLLRIASHHHSQRANA